ncbi:MAG: cytochrome b/b6 domain-containing protein [Halorhodospira halophila]|uniref:cytochrome b/b6 domain-containing protein n=1 Tax=Halorhodospira TaxID=85108 RepID=UPI001912C578|nr:MULTISPECIES: cytochrome b/b6 domain-containing protein [Halorhodospira]MCC3750336.1 cytochrome b/b6 domain-containing protein [Halorhodospira halophila]MCG5528105.1 cytochrome b/b6 domain-containing protein [Halorhodospira halophila]MCG5531874.1 cytochrome b/b6 domain-containing protein [Halorhodospira sp. 9621]MCG5537522.1 cytochrome b/b6 domain-containing protein [Halorhodospira sp. 9622]MCG5543023.1 cytochrome b/b6 domain-containing protein [Halorhodospira sp. 9628]
MEQRTIYVWDPVVRGSHWLITLLFAASFFTAVIGEMPAHLWVSYLLTVVVLARIVWGFVGPPQARFSHFVPGPRALMAHLRAMSTGEDRRYLGHPPQGGVMAVILLLGLVIASVSGMMLPALDRGAGPLGFLYGAQLPGELISDVHIVSSYTLLALVGMHILGVTLSGRREKQNLTAGMVDGYKRPSS